MKNPCHSNRRLTVSAQMRRKHRRCFEYQEVPSIRLAGLWLAQIFQVNDTIEVIPTTDGLILKKVIK